MPKPDKKIQSPAFPVPSPQQDDPPLIPSRNTHFISVLPLYLPPIFLLFQKAKMAVSPDDNHDPVFVFNSPTYSTWPKTESTKEKERPDTLKLPATAN